MDGRTAVSRRLTHGYTAALSRRRILKFSLLPNARGTAHADRLWQAVAPGRWPPARIHGFVLVERHDRLVAETEPTPADDVGRDDQPRRHQLTGRGWELVLDRVGTLWWYGVVMVVATAIAGEMRGAGWAAISLGTTATIGVLLVAVTARLPTRSRGIAVLVATAIGLATVAGLMSWPDTEGDQSRPSTAPPMSAQQATPLLPSLALPAGLDLAGLDLHGRNLRAADLRGARLNGAMADDAVLVDARLDGADLRGTSLRRAVLARACLRGADLRGADVTGADLTGADLRGARVDGVEQSSAAAWPSSQQQQDSGACS